MVAANSLLALVSLTAASLVRAHAVDARRLGEGESPLEVRLSAPSGNVAEIVAKITNTGPTDLNLVKVGSILDTMLPVQRLSVTDDAGTAVTPKGIHPSIDFEALREKDFELLQAGSSVETTVDGTAVHDFEKSGVYNFSARGLLHFAVAPSMTPSGPAILFESNTISLHVDARPAATKPLLQGRFMLQDGCNATEKAAALASISNCQKLALAAVADASDPSSKRFIEYFKSNSSSTRGTVIARLNAVAEECSSTDGGVASFSCVDLSNICNLDGPLVAYTFWDASRTVMCPLFWERPPLPEICHKQDHATTVIHETTHCEGVYAPHTNDWAYAYNASTELSPERALMNADNYSLYANGWCYLPAYLRAMFWSVPTIL